MFDLLQYTHWTQLTIAIPTVIGLLIAAIRLGDRIGKWRTEEQARSSIIDAKLTEIQTGIEANRADFREHLYQLHKKP